MTVLTCAAVQRRLPAYYDRELPIAELIAVDGHLNGCPPCASDLRELQSVGDALRIAAAPGPADDWNGLQPGVISRMKAEADESWRARTNRLFDDMHLVWIGLAATVATFVCGVIVLSMLRFASPERHDSLAAILAVMAAPSGSDLNPLRLDRYIRVPSVPENGPMAATLARTISEEELVLALSAVVTRDGSLENLAVLNNDDRREVL
ncbi:MAG: zf-HC2 domain-containing protein, partial [Acidobacteria bacterium]|nr:zf-HC2 domain-containing protein [Acidobacteriota bacterium]